MHFEVGWGRVNFDSGKGPGGRVEEAKGSILAFTGAKRVGSFTFVSIRVYC